MTFAWFLVALICHPVTGDDCQLILVERVFREECEVAKVQLFEDVLRSAPNQPRVWYAWCLEKQTGRIQSLP